MIAMPFMGYPGWPLKLSDELDRRIIRERQDRLRFYDESDGFTTGGVRLTARIRYKAGDNCIQCGKRFRPRRIPKAERPDTVLHQSGGRCSSCHDAHLGRRGRKSKCES